MTKDVGNKVKKMVADHLGVEESKVTDEAKLSVHSANMQNVKVIFERRFFMVYFLISFLLMHLTLIQMISQNYDLVNILTLQTFKMLQELYRKFCKKPFLVY